MLLMPLLIDFIVYIAAAITLIYLLFTLITLGFSPLRHTLFTLMPCRLCYVYAAGFDVTALIFYCRCL